MKIDIAKGLTLPVDVVTQVEVIIAKRRAGKSYTMRRVTEQLLKAEQQIILVDPKGDQWGIRSSADGKKPGFPVLILGGEHGDLPLEVNGGELVAKLVVEERVSILLDLSQFRKHEIATFMTSFLENLYRLKAQEKYRTPVKLVVDEADAIAPQKPQMNETRMLGAIEDIVRRGGQRGIGCTLVTQRSAVLNKNVLTQAQILVVLRTIAPQDLAAIKAWIDVHGSIEEGKALMDSLPSLPIGDAWFWSPGWPTEGGIFKRVHVSPIETFDSGATPKPGQKRIIPKNLADIDLDALKGQMAATIEKAKKNDPNLLHKEIAQLRAELAKRTTPITKETLAMGVSQWREYGKKYKYWDFFEKQINQQAGLQWERLLKEWKRYFKEVKIKFPDESPPDVPPGWMTPSNLQTGTLDARNIEKVITGIKEIIVKSHPDKPMHPPVDFLSESTDEVKKPQGGALRMLQVLVSRYPMKLTRSQLGTFAKLKPTSGTFGTYLSTLKANGYIEVEGDYYTASQAGIDYLGESPSPPQTSEETIRMWRENLHGGARRMFEILISEYPQWITKEWVGMKTALVPTSGTFGTYLSILKSNGLVEVRGQELKASESLFI